MNNKVRRLILDILLVIAVFNGWWFLALLLGLLGAIYFNYFFEFIIAGIVFDALFGYNDSLGFWGWLGTILSLFLFVLSIWLRTVLRR